MINVAYNLGAESIPEEHRTINVENDKTMELQSLSTEDILRITEQMKIKHSSGDDNLSTSVVKQSVEVLLEPIQYNEKFPEIWNIPRKIEVSISEANIQKRRSQ